MSAYCRGYCRAFSLVARAYSRPGKLILARTLVRSSVYSTGVYGGKYEKKKGRAETFVMQYYSYRP